MDDTVTSPWGFFLLILCFHRILARAALAAESYGAASSEDTTYLALIGAQSPSYVSKMRRSADSLYYK
jgi:hypothetical protein